MAQEFDLIVIGAGPGVHYGTFDLSDEPLHDPTLPVSRSSQMS